MTLALMFVEKIISKIDESPNYLWWTTLTAQFNGLIG
jgi:hypothetical protein